MNKYDKVAVQSTTTEQAQQRQRSRGSTNSLHHLQPSFLSRNRRQQIPARKALNDAKPEGLLQTVKENGQRKKPNKEKAQKKKTFTERPITIQILQRQRRRRQKQEIGKVTPAEEKLLKTKFTSKGPALFGSVQNLNEESKISRSQVKLFYIQSLHLQNIDHFVGSVIVYDIDEIWSIDLAYVDKLAEYNKNIKNRMVAVDCMSRYLRVQPLKSKYATSTAEAFKQMEQISHKKSG